MNVRRKAMTLLGAMLVLAIGVDLAQAAGPAMPRSRPARPARGSHATTLEQDRRIDVNNLNMFVTNFGAWGYDLAGNFNGGLFYPNHTTKTSVYAAGLWLGAKVGGEVRAAVAEYDQEFLPGRIIAGVPESPDDPDLRVYKVHAWLGDPSDTAEVHNPAADPALGEDDLVHDSWSVYVNHAKPFGAPTRMYTFTRPSLPDTVIEGPDVVGDQMLWCVYNDADPEAHLNEAGSTAPLGVQVEQTTFAFNRLGPLGNVIFVKYKITNAGTNTLDEMYVSQWADADLGQFTDDLVGCDTLPDLNGHPRSLGFCYNGSNHDDIYGDTPPALGVDFLQGPVAAGNDTLGLQSFARYINGTDPTSATESYNYMTGHTTDPNTGDPVDIVDPWGHVTRYMNAGDPQLKAANANDQRNWVDGNPADRRFFLSSGPFTMAPGETQTIVCAIMMGQCQDALLALSHLRFVDDAAQEAYDLNFQIPQPPPAPIVTATAEHGKVTIDWNDRAETAALDPGYTFEGYHVYQGPTIAGPWRLIAMYDEVNSIQNVFDKSFDNNACGPAFTDLVRGTNAGVLHEHASVQDFVRGTTIKDGNTYYFGVSSVAVNLAAAANKVQESAISVVRATAQRTTAEIGASLGKVLAVPNPYYAHSSYEQNQFSRKIRFLNTPAQCTMRIYNLAGQLVRTIEKNDPSTTVLEWDLTTGTRLPVGSGVFIYHLQSPGGGEAVGRVVVFMEKERLNNF